MWPLGRKSVLTHRQSFDKNWHSSAKQCNKQQKYLIYNLVGFGKEIFKSILYIHVFLKSTEHKSRASFDMVRTNLAEICLILLHTKCLFSISLFLTRRFFRPFSFKSLSKTNYHWGGPILTKRAMILTKLVKVHWTMLDTNI